jgi:hypothetical protein
MVLLLFYFDSAVLMDFNAAILKAETAMINAANTISVAEMGRVRKMLKSPADISSDVRSDFSMKGPRINASTAGASGMPSLRRK